MKAEEDIEYLKTIIFRQEIGAGKDLRNQFEDYMQTCYETEFEVSNL